MLALNLIIVAMTLLILSRYGGFKFGLSKPASVAALAFFLILVGVNVLLFFVDLIFRIPLRRLLDIAFPVILISGIGLALTVILDVFGIIMKVYKRLRQPLSRAKHAFYRFKYGKEATPQ